MQRPEISDESILKAIEFLTRELARRMEQHGRGAFASAHESLGDLTEEYYELIGAIQSNDVVKIGEETADVAVSALWALATSIQKEEDIKKGLEELSQRQKELSN